MPWSEISPMDQKTQFIADFQRLSLSFTELVQLYHISRKTGYKWIERYKRNGISGLLDRSRRPKFPANSTPKEMVELILEARRRHPTWGAKKLLAIIGRAHAGLVLPARSTICDVLGRHGMVLKKRRRRHVGHGTVQGHR